MLARKEPTTPEKIARIHRNLDSIYDIICGDEPGGRA